MGGDGKIRLLTSRDGKAWESAALLAEEGIDLRDPKLSVMPDGRLMMTLGGSVYRGGKTLLGRQPRVAFSEDGRQWTAPQRVMAEGDWLWRVTWSGKTVYGTSYRSAAPSGEKSGAGDWSLVLYKSTDGLVWEQVAPLKVPDRPNETTLRFAANGDCLALVRREGADRQAWLGTASAPYKEWQWKPAGRFIGGPNFLVRADGGLIACGRDLQTGSPARTALGPIREGTWDPGLTLPSGGDTSYAGMVEYEGLLWVSYYSAHEGKCSIYLAKVRL